MQLKDKGLINMAKIVEYSNSKGKLYRFRVYAGIDETTGKKKYIKRSGFKTKAQAKKELVKLEYEIANGGYFKQERPETVRDVYNIWIDQYRLTVKEATFFNAKRALEYYVLPAIGSYKVNSLTLSVCQKAVNEWASKCPGSVSIIKVYASALIKYAVKLEIANKNPFSDTTIPRTQKREKINFLDVGQLKTFLALAEKKSLKQYALFRLLAYSGMRIGELVALTWDDVNFADNTISINKTLSKNADGQPIIHDPKTKTSKRLLDMDVETMQILKRWKVKQASYLLAIGINAMSKSQLVFSNRSNELLVTTAIGRWCKQLLKAGDLPKITLHGFRHTHATLLLSAGASVKEVQNRLGHSDVSTTLNIYTHLTRQDQKETIQKFVRYLG
ncbi:integrase [Ligilactobacillus animalis KCTC 3501 = DSM 20602]|nr:integrase [Ligilactobacillus animalis KCTC 3501 = DSM 20602]